MFSTEIYKGRGLRIATVSQEHSLYYRCRVAEFFLNSTETEFLNGQKNSTVLCYQNKTYVIIDPGSMAHVSSMNYSEGNPIYKWIKKL